MIRRRIPRPQPGPDGEQKNVGSANISYAQRKQRELEEGKELEKEEERKPRPFDENYMMIYNNKSKGERYRERKGEIKTSAKWGQRKLTLTTIQFFTRYWDPDEIPKPKCLYIGAAPGCTINIMNVLFPDIEWHLYDSSEFNKGLIDKDNIHIYSQYFEDKDIDNWKTEKDLFLMSDIRNRSYKICNYNQKAITLQNRFICEKIVLNDMMTQLQWVLKLNPLYAHLKFRLPWAQGIYKDNKAICPYLQGHVYYQPWLGHSSSESRLVPTRNKKGDYHIINWDAARYESAMFYHNLKEKETFRYINPFTDDESHIDGQELTNDWDSLCEATILKEYLEKINAKVSQDNVIKLSRMITNTLNDSGIGCGQGSIELIRKKNITFDVESIIQV